MDKNRLRIGTKIKIISSHKPETNGIIGYVTSNSAFHDKEGDVYDRTGDIWLDNLKKPFE